MIKDRCGMSDTFKQEKLKDFTIIRNSIFKDYTLSAKAKGVACQLLSLPPAWDYSVRGLVTLFNDGEASIRSALNELEEAGYLRREQNREEGKFGKSVYIITDMLKSEKPCVENPLAEIPMAGNHAQYNTKELNTKELNTKRYRFIPPTVEEVEDYINEKGYNIDAHKFVDYYTANGWRVGKSPMKDWRAAVRNWSRNNYQSDKKQGSAPMDFISMWKQQQEKGVQ